MGTTTAQQLRDAVNATLGKDTVRMGSHEDLKVTYTPTGVLPIDILMQGGMPKGRFVQMHGDFSTLKSWIGLNICREYQARGQVAAVIDNEHSFDPDWAASVGVNVDDLIVKRPETGEEGMDIMDVLIRGGVGFVLFDSVAAALPQAETAKRLHGESMQPGRLAQLMSAAMRRLTTANTDTSVLWINQTRQNIGMTFGPQEALPGGKALPFYASYILSLRKVGKITRDVKFFDGEKWTGGKEQIGQRFRAEVLKSKLSKPFRDIYFTWSLDDAGIDLPNFLLSQGVENGFIEQRGNTWVYGDSVKAVGRQKFIDALGANDEAMLALENEVREFHGLVPVSSGTGQSAAAATGHSGKKVVSAARTSSRGKKPTAKKPLKGGS
jgi:recombination protein RecA